MDTLGPHGAPAPAVPTGPNGWSGGQSMRHSDQGADMARKEAAALGWPQHLSTVGRA